MLQHLGEFPARLAEHGHAAYEYTPCPPVSYPELEAELWCHRYYLRNLCDTAHFPDWPIADHVPFLQARLPLGLTLATYNVPPVNRNFARLSSLY